MSETIDPVAVIAEHLGAIRSVLEASHEASEKTRTEARAALEAQRIAREAEAARRAAVAQSSAPDFHPFVSMPAGTTARDLPDGGRLFVLADGGFVRVNARGEIAAVTDSGEVVVLAPARGGEVRLPDGRELAMKPEALAVTHEAAGIEGLPASVEPILVADERFSATMPDGTRLDVSRRARLATVVTQVGTVVILGARLEAIGEAIEVRLVSGGLRSFASAESRVQGVVEADGSVHVTMPGGEDLVVRFPEAAPPSLPTLPSEPFTFCEERRP